MRAQIFTLFLLLSWAAYAADLFQNSKEALEISKLANTSELEPDASEPQDALIVQRQQVLDELLEKVKKVLMHPLQLSAVPWDALACFGWPEEVESKFTKDWESRDLVTLKETLSKIHFKFLVCNSRLSDLNLWNAIFSKMMLKGTYSNIVFDRFTAQYRIISKIGKGAFGFVLKCERLSDSLPCAVKFILKQKLGPTHFPKNEKYGRVPVEVDALSKLDHPNIVKLLDYMDDGTYGYMVTELFGTNWNSFNPELNTSRNPNLRIDLNVKNGSYDLFDCIELHYPFPEETVHKIFSQVYDAVMYLYERGMIHGDLKSENILVDEDYNVKLIDFGLIRVIPRDSSGVEGSLPGLMGTLESMAPEMVLQKPSFGSETETWSLGVLLFLLAHSKNPFASGHQICVLNYKFPSIDETGIYDLMSKMLMKKPAQRIRLPDIASHRWMKQFQAFKLSKKRSFEHVDSNDDI